MKNTENVDYVEDVVDYVMAAKIRDRRHEWTVTSDYGQAEIDAFERIRDYANSIEHKPISKVKKIIEWLLKKRLILIGLWGEETERICTIPEHKFNLIKYLTIFRDWSLALEWTVESSKEVYTYDTEFADKSVINHIQRIKWEAIREMLENKYYNRRMSLGEFVIYHWMVRVKGWAPADGYIIGKKERAGTIKCLLIRKDY